MRRIHIYIGEYLIRLFACNCVSEDLCVCEMRMRVHLCMTGLFVLRWMQSQRICVHDTHLIFLRKVRTAIAEPPLWRHARGWRARHTVLAYDTHFTCALTHMDARHASFLCKCSINVEHKSYFNHKIRQAGLAMEAWWLKVMLKVFVFDCFCFSLRGNKISAVKRFKTMWD